MSAAPAVAGPVVTGRVARTPSLLAAFARAMGALVLCTLVLGALWSRAETARGQASAEQTVAQSSSSGARATP